MNRSSPTDPPDEPVNRIAGLMAEMEGKDAEALELSSRRKARDETTEQFVARISEGFALLMKMYHTNPEGDHRDAAVQIAKKHFCVSSICAIFLRNLVKTPLDRVGEALIGIFFAPEEAFTSDHAATVERIIRDLEKPETYEVIRRR